MTNAELAILTLVAERPRYGYELERLLEERGFRQWADVGFSTIYYILRKLERRGWVHRTAGGEPARGPARAVYQVTDDGLEAWRRALFVALSTPSPLRAPFLLGLAGLPGLPRTEVRRALAQHIQALEQERRRVLARWDVERGRAPYFVEAMFDWSVTMIEAQLTWLHRFCRERLNEEDISVRVLTDKDLFKASRNPELVDVPDGMFLTIAGQGAPESEGFATAVSAIYAVAYGIKFELKDRGVDFKVPPLEGLWSAPEGLASPRDQWTWKLLMRMPPEAEAVLPEVRRRVAAKRNDPLVESVGLERFSEGLAVQVLHVGPFADEPATLARLDRFIEEHGCRRRGLHHEIYLSDFRRTAPEKLKTILRQPVDLPS